ncbi:protein of unknown function [Trichlorobacter ammonificans]|uniref:Uncharacterized protein n=1 Tax=Trichlorobacter ammonificans TaxID=2916410 RepID=A0ABM9D913_9BACT|nr:protein of unknown function [Trichlorobacter ammonificans]
MSAGKGLHDGLVVMSVLRVSY